MASRPPVHSQLTAHRADAVASNSLMRATNADIHKIIAYTRKVMDETRDVMRRADQLLRAKGSRRGAELLRVGSDGNARWERSRRGIRRH